MSIRPSSFISPPFRFAIVSMLLLWASPAAAHVKWFVEPHQNAVPPYHLTDLPVLAGIGIALLIILAALLYERRGPHVPASISANLHRFEPYALSLFGILTGAALLVSSALGYVFAPNLVPEGGVGIAMLLTQALIGGALVLGVFVRLAGIILGGLYIYAVTSFGALDMADALAVLGISLLLVIVGRPKWRITKWRIIDTWTRRFHPYAIPILRIFTGLNLLVLGFTEKILNPELGVAFLADHPWNFMQHFGFASYTDYWFVFSAGVVEALLGIIFLLGIATRVNTLVLAGFFTASLALMGPTEVYGHLMHFAIVGILLVFDGGRRWRPLSPTERR